MFKYPKPLFWELWRLLHVNTNNNGLSVVAVDSKTNEVVGTFTAQDGALGHSKEMEQFFMDNFGEMSKSMPVQYVVDELDA